MNSVQGQPNSMLLSVGVFVVFILLIYGVTAFLSHVFDRVRIPVGFAMMAATMLFGAVLLLSWSVGTRSPQVISPAQPAVPPQTLAPTLFAEFPEAAPPVVVSPNEVSADGSTKPQLPEWTTRNPVRDGQRRLVVLNGGRFASEQEAELHAFDQATLLATQEFRRLDPQGIGSRLEIHRDEIRRTAIKQRFLEVREHDFGKSKGLMYQVWLQLELTPDLGERLATPWRQAAVDARVRTLAACGIWLTAIAGLISFAFRWDSTRRGRNRTALCVTVVIVAAGSLLFVA